jgi:hypothetical protein
LARSADRFFVRWRALLLSLLTEARDRGELPPETDCDASALLVMSVIEGALLMCKASKDTEAFGRTAEILKGVLSGRGLSAAGGAG